MLVRVVFVLFCLSAPLAAGGSSATSFVFPHDPLAVPGTDEQPGWVKFTILLSDPSTVIFQDSRTYPFHFDFAVAELPQFQGMTPTQFDDVTLHAAGQQAVLGAVILPSLVGYVHAYQEYGIQLVRQDPYTATEVRDLFNAVRAAVVAEPFVEAFYFPSFEQQAAAEANREFLESEGIIISSSARWASGNGCYSGGWALGPLKFFPAGEIDAAHLAGELLAGDVLLTDAVPAEIPFVAGVLSLSPSTPNSHVAILAETFGVPFAHLAVEGDAQRAQDLLGHRIALRVERDFSGCQVRLIDVEGVLDAATIDEILALKQPPPLNITPIQTYGAYGASTDGLQLSDLRYFGGKAANFGVLRRAIPLSSPVATALSFDLWTGFMNQVLTGGNTLRQEIAERLSVYVYPPEVGELAATLNGIQDLIQDTDETVFDPSAVAAVLATLQDPQYDFDPLRKLRFRSSTNVEDTDRFTGAGLYESFNGCLADDLDGDAVGPSACDPDQSGERSVFRAIRRVFASFYNLNAYLERMRHGIDENDVGMAILVHHSFPDEDELANGVATMEQFAPTRRGAYIVSQAGDSSVTNPEPGAIAEEVDVWIPNGGGTPYPTLIRPSNLVQLGATVMEFAGDYQALTLLLWDAAALYGTESGLEQFTVEFEFKKMAPDDRLVVKQIRRLPRPDDVASITPFLIDEPVEYCLFQGEFSDVFANHRLKSRWQLSTESLWLTEENLQSSFFAEASLEYQEVCQLYGQTGPLPQWPLATHGFSAGSSTDSWTFDSLQNPRTYTLNINDVPTLVAPSESPLLVLSDFGWPHWPARTGCLPFQVDYDRPVPTIDWTGPTMTTTDYGLLCPCPGPMAGESLQQRTIVDGELTIRTAFYWPPEPGGISAGYTAPAIRFLQTIITGLTSTPIVLEGEYSQTYRPEHHNFGENFIFEPALEPDLPQQQLDELAAAGVRVIRAVVGFEPGQIAIHDEAGWGDRCLACSGFDGDGDGHCTGAPSFDCDDEEPEAWSRPGEALDLTFADRETLHWSAPSQPGGSSPAYDLLRAAEGDDFATAVCLELVDPAASTATDATTPDSGGLSHYLVRATNACPEGEGPLGLDSAGEPRLAPPCP